MRDYALRSRALAVLLVLTPSGLAQAQQDGDQPPEPAPLFQSDEVLSLTVRAPLKTIFREREQDSEYHPGQLSFESRDGERVTLDVRLKTRGKTRLMSRICRFPPLRVDFRRSQVPGTPFEGQNNLKVVTHCQDRRKEYEQGLLLEYLAYRAFNELSEMSFRVRLARVTWIDTDDDRDTVTKYAFFIEDEDRMAERNGWEVLKAPIITPGYHDPHQLNVVEVFQYMIGNTDWDPFRREPDKAYCCHNLVPIGNMAGPAFGVPYDFDWSGLIDARYARPNENLPIRSVRQRLYRGLCRPEEVVSRTLAIFFEKRDAIFNLFNSIEGLEDDRREKAIEYLEEFYETIGNERQLRSKMLDDCRNA